MEASAVRLLNHPVYAFRSIPAVDIFCCGIAAIRAHNSDIIFIIFSPPLLFIYFRGYLCVSVDARYIIPGSQLYYD